MVDHDLVALVDHIVEVTGGDFAAAGRRLDEVDDLVAAISANPLSGVRLGPPLEGWLVRHGGRGHRLTVVFRADRAQDCIFVVLIAFGGQDWITEGKTRKSFVK
ncbi:type II toxin-antitoxin system RelE/ParE family toxin [Albidovulum sp.]|uniref:type II toxin-antitoxin system RelE/ParE family toxin n=1 Tax=Albidovulum sp. TaxID=1872424 RepID=UPI0039B8E535